MRISFIYIILILFSSIAYSQSKDEVFSAIQAQEILSYGGCDILLVQNHNVIVGVSAVDVGTKKMSSLVRVGKIKAEREVLTFINGSTITSSTESYIKEELITINDSSSIKTVDIFVESIREDSEGFIKGMKPAGYWYSDDKSVFYYAIFKEVNIN